MTKTHNMRIILDRVPDNDYLSMTAYHEATHCVMAMVVGRRVKEVWMHLDRRIDLERTNGVAHTTGPDLDYQLVGMELISGGIGGAKRARELGYCELTQTSAEVLDGNADMNNIWDSMKDGYTFWTTRAQQDVTQILDERRIWKSVGDVAHELLRTGRLTGDEVHAIVGSATKKVRTKYWVPNWKDFE